MQAERVHRLLAKCRRSGERAYISNIVLCETVWVLRSALNQRQHEILEAMELIIGADVFQLENPDILRTTVDRCRQDGADLTDCLIGQLNMARGCRTTMTFDRRLRNIPGFSVL